MDMIDTLRGRRTASLRSSAVSASVDQAPPAIAPRPSTSFGEAQTVKKSNWEVIEHFSASKAPTTIER
ncbi:unnamed protein product [Leptidea sinapis]|uniref:Uncharacterized protein n=1 Tax=Leptidea sinapis TaxID=189913 RepID=A0A5E4PM82_9NEOP|nr:unnamed protein product [Leptidea sinapis]